MEAIRTSGGALISPALFQKSETEFLKSFPDEFKLTMFRNLTLKECNEQLKALYSIHGKKKKKNGVRRVGTENATAK